MSNSHTETEHDANISLSAGDLELLADGQTVGPWIINDEVVRVEVDEWELEKVEVTVDE